MNGMAKHYGCSPEKALERMGALIPFLLLMFMPIACSKEPSVADPSADIAIYMDAGVDEDCVDATRNMFQWMGYSVRYVSAYTIRHEGLDDYRLLCIPGGDMYQYGQDLHILGAQVIRDFISAGGGYIGICGGGYFTGREIYWRGDKLVVTSLELFPGITRGPNNAIVPYPDYGMCKVNIVDSLHPITSAQPDTAWILYYWGPEFFPDSNATVSILGEYDEGGNAALCALTYGSGRVFVTGPHPEFEEDDDRDGTTLGDEFDDRGTDWELMKRATQWCLKEIP
jgi:glutamine amidotransferase-like uncharacterized protein